MTIERLSIELTNRCGKGCDFCYNHSLPEGETRWKPEEVIAFVEDCAKHGARAVSFGGGEPLQYEGWEEVLSALRGTLFRSMTTNGLLLDEARSERLAKVAPEKVHVSIHFPERSAEVERVIRQVGMLSERGIRSGVNFLVARSKLSEAEESAQRVREAGIGNDRIVYLPMRGRDTPTPRELARVAGHQPFQSMTCLTQCGASPRFCSLGWDKTVAWCSYTITRRPLREMSYRGLCESLEGLGLEYCGEESLPLGLPSSPGWGASA